MPPGGDWVTQASDQMVLFHLWSLKSSEALAARQRLGGTSEPSGREPLGRCLQNMCWSEPHLGSFVP